MIGKGSGKKGNGGLIDKSMAGLTITQLQFYHFICRESRAA
jgi:hypothetical protein